MNLGITLAPVRQKCEQEGQALRMIRAAGFDCVDYSFHNLQDPQMLSGPHYLDHARRVRALLDTLGLRCTQAHAPFDFRFGGKMSPEQPEWNAVVRSMEFARILGARHIVVHSVLTPAQVDLVKYNVCYFKSFEEYCARFDIRIAFENIFDYDRTHRCMGRFETPALVREFLEQLDSTCFVACLDMGHAAISGVMPEDFIRGMTPEPRCMLHVQDTDYLDDRHQLPYMGLQNWDASCRALAEIGYSGDFTFEIPGYFRRMPAPLAAPALEMAASVGRYLIEQIERAKRAAV